MHALKSCASSLKNPQEKIFNLIKSTPVKSADGNVIGMVTESSKPKITSPNRNLKSQNEDCAPTSTEQSKFHSSITVTNTNSNKRKNIVSENSIEKRFKSDNTTRELDLSEASTKKLNKSKSIYPKTYLCKFCCRRFFSEEHLQEHSKTHGSKPSHICYLCNHQTASFSALMTHYLKHSGNKGDKLDKIYAKSKADFSNIQFNISSCSKPSFRCSKCKLSFTTKLKYDSHNCFADLLKGEYNCAYCGHVSYSVEDYRNHILSHSETPFKCLYCKYKAPTKKQLDKHREQCRKRSKPSILYKCDKCTKFNCKNKKELDEHSKMCETHNTTNNTSIKSHTKNSTNTDNHIKDSTNTKNNTVTNNHTKKNPNSHARSSISYTCEKCSTVFCYKKSYYNHVSNCNSLVKKKRKKLKDNVKNDTFSCIVCECILKSKSEHEEHEMQCLTNTTNITNERPLDFNNVITSDRLAEPIEKCLDQNESAKQKECENANDIKTCSDHNDSAKQKECENANDIKALSDHNESAMQKEYENANDIKACSDQKEPESAIDIKAYSDEQKPESAIDIIACSDHKESDIQEKSGSTVKRKVGLNKNKINMKKKSIKNIDKKACSVKNKILTLEESVSTVDGHATRRSSRLVRRKTFDDDDDDDDNEAIRKKNSLKIKISKNTKSLLKSKFRSRQTKNTNNSFICNICDFSFCSKSTLLRHKRMHSGNPWYTCQYCGKFFFRKDVYLRHEMNVHSKSSKAMFCCCYCKLCFKEAPSLKDHVMAEHKDSAFLPSSTKRVSGKVFSESFTESPIKQEIENKKLEINISDLSETTETVNKNTPTEAVTSNASYKCSVCSKSFKNASDIAVHMLTHPDNLQNKNNDEISDFFETRDKEHLPNLDEPTSFKFGKLKACNAESFYESNLTVPDSIKSIASIDADDVEDNLETCDVNNPISAVDEIQPSTNQPDYDNSESLKCALCFKQFTDKNLLDAHKTTMHKVVDWYQCLVCSASGPRQEMQDHMFSHMFKVGTFVVNSSSRNFDAIVSYLAQENDRNETNAKNSDACKESNSSQQGSLESINLVCEDDLPPLREFGLCPCIDSKFEEDIMPKLHKETVMEFNCNNSERLKVFQEKSSSCIDINDDINMNSETTVIKCSENNSIVVGTDINDDINMNSLATAIKGSENNSITVGTDINDYININSETVVIKCSENNSSIVGTDINDDINMNSKTTVIKFSEDNNCITVATDRNDDIKMKLNVPETTVLKSSEDNNSITETTDNIDDIEMNLNVSEISVIKSYEENNSVTVTTDIDNTKMNLNVSEIEAIKSYDDNNSIAVTTDIIDDIKMNLNLSETSAIKPYKEDNSIIVSTAICSKSGEVFEGKEESIKEESDCLSAASFSSQVKDEHNLSFQSDGSVSDNQRDRHHSESFSQLRYLLQKPHSVKSSENKITLYPEMSGFNYDSSNLFVKYVSNIEETNVLLPQQQNQQTDALNLTTENKHGFDLSKQNSRSFNNEINYDVPVSPAISPSTCLKFDINQSRGEFSEIPVISTLNSKLQNCELDKTENFFKPCPSQSPILDFSDLIQHSFENSGPCEDNIFSYSTPVKQVNSLSDACNREEVRTPDCSDIVKYDCSTCNNSVKCEYCNEDLNGNSNHKCIYAESRKSTDMNLLYKSKNILQPFHYIENQNKISNVVNTSEQKLNILSPSKSSEAFMYAKLTSSEIELDRYRKSPIVENPPNQCNRCQRTFSDIGELMKHSLVCLKSLFFRTPHTSDCVTTPTLHTFVLKDESKANFSGFSLNSSLPYNPVTTEPPHTSSEDFKLSFDS